MSNHQKTINDKQAEEPGRISHKATFWLALPIVFSNFSVPLLGAVDTAVMGHAADAVAMGAVGLGGTLVAFVFWMFGFLKMVTSGQTAQAFGRLNRHTQEMAQGTSDPTQKQELAKVAGGLSQVLARALLMALAFSLLIILFQEPILSLGLWFLEPTGALEQQVRLYYGIRIWSAPFSLALFVLVGWQIGVQKTRQVMIVVLTTNFLNIGLNLLFVLVFGWGVAGVASASVVAEVFGFIFAAWMVWRGHKHQFKAMREGMKLKAFRSLLSANSDMMIRTFCLEMAFFSLFKLSTAMGEVTLAANIVIIHYFGLMAHATDAFAQVAETLTGEAIGRKDRRGYRRAFWITLQQSCAAAALFALIFYLFKAQWIVVFTDLPAVADFISTHFIWVVLIPLTSIVSMHFDGVFIGATRTREMRNAMIFSCGLFVATLPLLNLWQEEASRNHVLLAWLNLFMIIRALAMGYYLPALFRAYANPTPDE